MKMKDKIALVTGASRGIGAAIARKLAGEGASVAVVYNGNRNAAQQVVQAIRGSGGQAAAFQADVADEASVQAMVQQVAAAFGRIDILVNAAGILEVAPVGQISRESFHAQFYTNAWSVVAATQAVLPYLPVTGACIVNVSSSLVLQPKPGSAVYSASKGAVDVLTHSFALELGARGIRVNAVAPHITRTDMTAGIPPERIQAETALTPLGRLAEPEDIADAVAFLASDDARWITGRTILTDGGRM
ncbi:SDR family NAD(P)-dependent oxidoreductase [Paraherbaspirillum soli]|uniref:SDR family NAD(P)-dependent oxidoreductase n=1 Tax=Paraherbaspirillum soli TaxID=631222 RepID=A0ABW0M5K4_9BURK